MDLISTPYKLDQKSKHIAKLQTLENATIINIQLKKGETIAEHESSKDVVIVVRRGAVSFDVEGAETVVEQDNMLYMKPNEKHSLLAVEDTDILVFQIMP
jgi:quercetin dioxygenase-like cupin family protein